MSLFTPFELVHAHLPAAAAASYDIRQVTVPSDRAFPETEDEWESPLHQEHAVSAAFDPRTAIVARSVCNGYVLELRSISPAVTKGHPADPSIIRILLPDRLRPLIGGCVVPSLRAGRLVVVAVTEADVVYRFSFPLSSFVDKGSRCTFDVKDDDDWAEEWTVDEDMISSAGGVGSWAVTNEDTVVLGCADGGIIKVARSPQSTPESPAWSESHHRATSRLRIGSLFSRQADEMVTSIAEFDYEDQIPVLYTYSRDAKLRTWSSVTGQCLKSLDVRPSSSSTELVPRSPSASQQNPASASPETSASLLRVIAHPNPSSRYSHIVVVFVPAPYNPTSPGTFIFFRASNTAHNANDLVYAGERAASSDSSGSELRGFEIQPPTRADAADGWRLWAVWDSAGALTADSVPVNDILQFTTYLAPPLEHSMVQGWQKASYDDKVEQFDAAYFDNLLGLDAPDSAQPYDNADIAEAFLAHLFYPGRFSELTLTTALNDYIEQLPFSNQEILRTTVYPTLSSKFAAAVGSSLTMETSPQTGAPVVEVFRKALKLDWLGIWARVREMDKQARWPVASTSLNGQVLILDREGVAVPVQQDTPGVLVNLGRASESVANDSYRLPEGALLALHPAIAPPLARKGLTAVARAGESMVAALKRQDAPEDMSGSALDNFTVIAAADVEDGFGPEPVETVAGRLWEDTVEPYLSDDDRAALQKTLQGAAVARALSESLDLFATWTSPTSGESLASSWAFSGLGNTLLSATISAIIQSRYLLARNVLLVALYHLSTTGDLDSEADDGEDLIEILARAYVIYQRYRVLYWFTQQTGDDAIERSSIRRQNKSRRAQDDVLAKFDSLKVREGGEEPLDYDGFHTSYSLLHSLLARGLSQPVPVDTAACFFDSANTFLATLDIVKGDMYDPAPLDADVKLASAVLTDGHAGTVVSLTALYPTSSGSAFVRGCALLHTGHVEEGVKLLEVASAGCYDGTLAAILPTCVGKEGLGEYFRRVMVIVDEHGLEAPVAHFGNLALQSSKDADPATSDVWTRVFLAYLSLGEYEAAYSVLTSTPFTEIRRELLSQLISAMCEANEVGRLNKLGFIGFQKQVEERLNFKARNSDPLRFPNYYKVLYSWHISRGDYRSAGEIMYAQGQRFAEASSPKLSAFELQAMRARSYLAAINALSLVDKRNAWISVHVAPESTRSQKRRKVSTYIPDDKFGLNNRAVDIVTLSDIQAEYAAVLSQLQLSREIPDLQQHGVSLSADEIVGFFTQRSAFDLAQSSAASMGADMTDMFETLATRCVELARAPGVALDSPSAAFLATSPTTQRLRGPPATLALRYLQVALDRHDGPSTQFRYTAAVSDVFFALNKNVRSGWQPPVWLVDGELTRDAEGWISRGLEFGWVRESVGWASEVLRRAPAVALLPKGKPDAVDVPYNLIDRVLAAAEEGDEKVEADVQAAAKVLRETVTARVKAMKK